MTFPRAVDPGHTARPARHAPDEPPPFAWRAVAIVTAAAGVLFAAGLGRYEFGGDELYFIAAGKHPAFGYADQGPLIPLLAAAADALDPGSTVALRLPALVATLVAIVLCAAITREFGGGRAAQTLAALAYAATPAAVMQSAILTTFALDATFTAAISWLLIRWVRTRRDPLLVAAWLVAALDLQVKWLVPLVWAGLIAGVLLFGPREMLRRGAFWLGAALFTAAALPTLWWQQVNGWPQLGMGAVIRGEQLATSGGTWAMPWQIIMVTGPMGALLLIGMWAGARWEALRPYRFLIPIVCAWLLAVLLGGLRTYYVVGAFPGLFAAGAAYLAWRGVGSWLRACGLALVALGVAISVLAVLALPISETHLRPTDTYAQIDWRARLFGPSGWNDLLAGVEDAHGRVPAAERPGLIIITQNYWQAAGLEHFGRTVRLPPIYSLNRGYGYFPPPPDTATTVLYVGVDAPDTGLGVECAEVIALTRIDRPLGFPSVNRDVTVWLCREPRVHWSTDWPSLRTLRMVDGTSK
ncbi:ArnT family glycosyltransferase [Nocardia sp. NPDC057668]|uniref:ArnT family glycosyltransferase n=1 Tax=Nocardia sp. NPDC057668 TaxID=3346202 RepID=UPI0036707B72